MPPHRIVAIDSDAQIGRRLYEAFTRPEFELHWFAAGREALEGLEDMQPDAIVCELMLPDIGGRAVLDAVKRSPGLRRVPFLVLSGVRSEATIRATLDAGAEAFLLKPFPVSKLVQTIRRVLGDEATDDSGPRIRASQGDAVSAVGRVGPVWASSSSEGEAPAPDAASRQRIGFNTRDPLPAAPRAEAPVPAPASHEPVASREALAPAAGEPAGPEALPPIRLEGRISTLDLGGARVRITTEAEQGRGLVLRTTVVQDGHVLRRIETNLDHLLEGGERHKSLKDLIEVQHAVVLQEVGRPGVSAAPPQAEPARAAAAPAAPEAAPAGPASARGPASSGPAEPRRAKPRARRRAAR